MKNSILFIVLTLFLSVNITSCSLFSSGGDEQETATITEDGAEASGTDDFASDDFESAEGP